MNHRFPSGPEVIDVGPLDAVIENSVIVPEVVIRPIFDAPVLGEPQIAVGAGGDPLRLAAGRQSRGEQRDRPRRGDPADALVPRGRLGEPQVPVGPAVMPHGAAPEDSEYSVIDPPVVILPMSLACSSVNHRFPSGPAVIIHGFELLECVLQGPERKPSASTKKPT